MVILGRSEGREVLRGLLSSPAEEDTPEVVERAGLVLGASLRRDGDYEGALRVWKTLDEMGSLNGAIEHAKLLEHHLRDFKRAAKVVERAIEGAGAGAFHAALVHRLGRLHRKLSTGRRA